METTEVVTICHHELNRISMTVNCRIHDFMMAYCHQHLKVEHYSSTTFPIRPASSSFFPASSKMRGYGVSEIMNATVNSHGYAI